MMKKLKFPLYLMFASLLASGFVACSGDDDDDDPFAEKENALAPAISQYVNNTVIATYKSLADASILLYVAIDALKNDPTNDNLVTAATRAWKDSRIYWERSEAFLYGAVADFGIDPHIDTWPLDETAFNNTIENPGFIISMAAEGGDVWAANTLGYALLGFHGIEYIFFREGSPKRASEITAEELIYARAVAGDLRNQCVRLEASWAGIDAVSSEKKNLIEELELEIIPSTTSLSYGENMLTAGKTGSTYRTVTDAARAIIAGCITISDEVGEVKIGTAYNAEDINYIESPYSYNSIVDFVDNIKSIENAYLGGADENKRGASVSDYVQSIDSDLDGSVKAAITNAIDKINAIPAPFAKNYTSSQAGDAIEACADLTAALEKVQEALGK